MLRDLETECFSTVTVVSVAVVSFLTGTTCGYITARVMPSTTKNEPSPRLPSLCESDNDNSDRDEKEEKFENCVEELDEDTNKKKAERAVSFEYDEQVTEAPSNVKDELNFHDTLTYEADFDEEFENCVDELDEDVFTEERERSTSHEDAEQAAIVASTMENASRFDEETVLDEKFKSSEEESADEDGKNEDRRVTFLEFAEDAAEAASIAANDIALTEKDIPKFDYEQLRIGKFLTKGKFCDVFEVTEINRKRKRQIAGDYDATQSHQDDDNEKIERRYAVKYLHRTAMSDHAIFKSGAIELAVEAKLLSSINHPNIVKIHGVSDSGLAGFSAGTLGCYFLLLDRLDCTLEKKIYHSWKRKQMELRKRRTGTFNKMFATTKDDKKVERREFFIHRLGVALDIAGAIEHLHSLNVVYRDVQPGNIGFDSRGNVKLFNLGLARELRPDKRNRGKLCKISGSVGHIRYRAPEMALGRSYNLLVDVYSFTLLLWEIISIKKPFEGMTKHAYSLLVLKNSERPPIDLSLSFRLRSLLKTGWSKRPNERPKMSSICKDLEKEIQKRLSDSNRSTSSSLVSSRRPSFGSSQASLLEEDLYSSMELETMNGSSESFLSERDARIENVTAK